MAKRGNPNLVYHDDRHPNARFSNATVRRIRRRVLEEGVTTSEIAAALGCHRDTILKIVKRQSYGAVL